MKYTKLTLITLAVAALMTACGQKDTSTTNSGQDTQKAAPVVSIITAQTEDVRPGTSSSARVPKSRLTTAD